MQIHRVQVAQTPEAAAKNGAPRKRPETADEPDDGQLLPKPARREGPLREELGPVGGGEPVGAEFEESDKGFAEPVRGELGGTLGQGGLGRREDVPQHQARA